MKPGELVAARMSGGITLAKILEVEASRVKILFRRNREARLPVERVLLNTGIQVSDDNIVEDFRQKGDELASSIDIFELWEVVNEDPVPMTLNDIAELYWGDSPEPVQQLAMLLYMEGESLYFVSDKEGYTPRTQEAVQEILDRRQREAENKQASQELMESLSKGSLPEELNTYQQSLVDYLKGFAVHGEDYTRSTRAKSLLNQTGRARGDLQKFAFQLLVNARVFSPDEPLELERAGIVEGFEQEAIDEAIALDGTAILSQAHRSDFTHIPTVTIDDAGTEDKDDALSLEVESDGEAGKVYRVGIHITDAGSLIPVGGVLDQEADRRMATLYLPERRIHMLPPEVSHAKGSLESEEHRATLSLMVRLTESGEILDWEALPSLIRSRAALSYDEVDAAIEDSGHAWHEMMVTMHSLAQALRSNREKAGATNLERTEMSVKVSQSGEVEVRIIPRSTPSRQMVSEFMVLCNSLLAEFCKNEGIPASYRSQKTADLSNIGEGLPIQGEIPDGPLRWYLMIRRMAPADISTTPGPHGGLGVPAYIQVSSPLRRYPDMVMQRQISHYLNNGTPLYSTEEIASVAQRAEVQLRELSKIEEERRRYWFLKYLRQRMSQPNQDGHDNSLFNAIVLENQPERSAQLDLMDYPFRIRARLPNSILPGYTVTMRLHGVDLWSRVGQFVHIPDPD